MPRLLSWSVLLTLVFLGLGWLVPVEDPVSPLPVSAPSWAPIVRPVLAIDVTPQDLSLTIKDLAGRSWPVRRPHSDPEMGTAMAMSPQEVLAHLGPWQEASARGDGAAQCHLARVALRCARKLYLSAFIEDYQQGMEFSSPGSAVNEDATKMHAGMIQAYPDYEMCRATGRGPVGWLHDMKRATDLGDSAMAAALVWYSPGRRIFPGFGISLSPSVSEQLWRVYDQYRPGWIQQSMEGGYLTTLEVLFYEASTIGYSRPNIHALDPHATASVGQALALANSSNTDALLAYEDRRIAAWSQLTEEEIVLALTRGEHVYNKYYASKTSRGGKYESILLLNMPDHTCPPLRLSSP
jgi:hypothetical protein